MKIKRSKDSSGVLRKKRKQSDSKSKNFNKTNDYEFIGSGTYGCVISPPYYEKNNIAKVYVKYSHQESNDVGKLFKSYKYFINELETIQQVIKLDPHSNFTIKMKGAVVYDKLLIENDAILECLSYTDNENSDDDDSEVDDDFKSSDSDLANDLLAAISSRAKSNRKSKKDLKKDSNESKAKEASPNWGQIIFEDGGVQVNKMFEITYEDCLQKFEVFLKGMIKLQENNYVHQDIKPANVLISPSKISLIDFGLSMKTDEIYDKNNYKLLSYSKYKYYPPEYAIVSIMMKNHWNTFSNISDIQAKLDNHDGFFNKSFFINNNKTEIKFRKGIIKFFNEIKKRNITKIYDVFNKDLALKVDVFSIAFIICCFDKHILYTNNEEKLFINDLYQRCIEPNPFERISIEDLYDIVKKENKQLKISRKNNFGVLPLSNFNLMNMEETISQSNKGGNKPKLITTECNRVPLKILR